MNIKVNLQDGTPAQFKTEIVDGAIVVTVVEEKKEEVNLFPKWKELGEIKGYWIEGGSELIEANGMETSDIRNSNVFTTSDLAKAALATARVSQTYRRYRELVGEFDAPTYRQYGLLRVPFKSGSDAESFYEANKGDLDLILKVSNTVQL